MTQPSNTTDTTTETTVGDWFDSLRVRIKTIEMSQGAWVPPRLEEELHVSLSVSPIDTRSLPACWSLEQRALPLTTFCLLLLPLPSPPLPSPHHPQTGWHSHITTPIDRAGSELSSSINTWLDSIKAGWSDRFGHAFQQIGVDDVSDLPDVDDKLKAELKEELVKDGAKSMHLKKIFEAVDESSSAGKMRRRASFKDREIENTMALRSIADACAWRESSSKPFAAFLSHHKGGCAMEARFIKGELERMLKTGIFLDSDDLKDLKMLLDHVRNSDVLVVLQSEQVLQRPWCLLEIHAALEARVPIVSVNCLGKGYDFAAASTFLRHLDTELDIVSPGALDLIRGEGVDPLELAYKLSRAIPNIIAVNFDSSASRNVIQASLLDLLDSMRHAEPQVVDEGGAHFEHWKTLRNTTIVSPAAHGGGGSLTLAAAAPLDCSSSSSNSSSSSGSGSSTSKSGGEPAGSRGGVDSEGAAPRQIFLHTLHQRLAKNRSIRKSGAPQGGGQRCCGSGGAGTAAGF